MLFYTRKINISAIIVSIYFIFNSVTLALCAEKEQYFDELWKLFEQECPKIKSNSDHIDYNLLYKKIPENPYDYDIFYGGILSKYYIQYIIDHDPDKFNYLYGEPISDYKRGLHNIPENTPAYKKTEYIYSLFGQNRECIHSILKHISPQIKYEKALKILDSYSNPEKDKRGIFFLKDRDVASYALIFPYYLFPKLPTGMPKDKDDSDLFKEYLPYVKNFEEELNKIGYNDCLKFILLFISSGGDLNYYQVKDPSIYYKKFTGKNLTNWQRAWNDALLTLCYTNVNSEVTVPVCANMIKKANIK